MARFDTVSRKFFPVVLLSGTLLVILFALLINFQKDQSAKKSFAATAEQPPVGTCHGPTEYWKGPSVVSTPSNLYWSGRVEPDQAVYSSSNSTINIPYYPPAGSFPSATLSALYGHYQGWTDNIRSNQSGPDIGLVIRSGTRVSGTGIGTRENGFITNHQTFAWCGDWGDSWLGCQQSFVNGPQSWVYPGFLPANTVSYTFEWKLSGAGSFGWGNPPATPVNGTTKIVDMVPIYKGGCEMPSGWSWDPNAGKWKDPNGNYWWWDPTCNNGVGCWRNNLPTPTPIRTACSACGYYITSVAACKPVNCQGNGTCKSSLTTCGNNPNCWHKGACFSVPIHY